MRLLQPQLLLLHHRKGALRLDIIVTLEEDAPFARLRWTGARFPHTFQGAFEAQPDSWWLHLRPLHGRLQALLSLQAEDKHVLRLLAANRGMYLSAHGQAPPAALL